MNLEDYRKTRDLTYEELASFLELKTSTTFRICKGTRIITLEEAHQILMKTHGRVSYEDLLPN
jgi:plasmid maintenance system antidote protein VapI